MTTGKSEISVRGRSIEVPSANIDGREVVVIGRWLRIAALKDEEWQDASGPADPLGLARQLRASPLRADILVLSGDLDCAAVHDLVHELDNVAVIDTTDFKKWWESLPQEARKNTRRAAKRGIEVRPAVLDEVLGRGIKRIYDETPVRQGRPFWHYGKELDQVIRENDTYRERSEFLGAYLGTELVGFIKWVRVGNAARIMQILCLNSQQDRRPIIALIAKAAETCHQKGMRYLIYGKYTYDRRANSSITEFKRRLGFTRLDFPRYYIALNWRGRAAMALGTHLGLKALLPTTVYERLLKLRTAWLTRRTRATADTIGSAASDV